MARKRRILLSKGNRKLGVGKDTVIMNITSATDCPSRKLGLCQVPPGACYALRSEKFYKGALPYRRRQTRVWDKLSVEELAEQVKDVVARKRGVPIRYLRMQEAGDFRSAADIDKMSRLADLLRGTVTVYTYTARRDLFPRPHSSNLVINGSGFMVDNNYMVVNEDQLGPGPRCRAVYTPLSKNPCYRCTLCKIRGHKVIQESLRGSTKRVVPVELRGKKAEQHLLAEDELAGVGSGARQTVRRKIGRWRHTRAAVNAIGGLR